MPTRRFSYDLFDVALVAVCLLVTAAMLYPFWYVFVLSLNDGLDALRGGVYLWPRSPTAANYVKFFNDKMLMNGLGISVLKTAAGTAAGVVFTSLVAYGLSYNALLYKRVYMTVILVAMYVSGGLIPYFVVLRSLHLIDTFALYILPNMLNLFLMFIFISFFRELPEVLAESARLDGASELRIFFRIMAPISKPVFATAALFFAVDQWNAWIDSAYFVHDMNLRPLMYHMMQIINKSQTYNIAVSGNNLSTSALTEAVTSKSLQMTAVIISVVPILAVYPFLQRYFVRGMALGAVKE